MNYFDTFFPAHRLPSKAHLQLIAPAAFECKFWIANDGWHAVADGLEISVHAGSFEDAKRSMEAALKQVRSVTRKEAIHR